MKRSLLIASGILLAVVLWMASGWLLPSDPSDAKSSTSAAADTTPLTIRHVQVHTFEAEPVTREVVLHGATKAFRAATIRAETAGRIVATPTPKGVRVQADAPLIRLADDARREQLQQAEAQLKQRELEYAGAKSLKERNLNDERQLAEARTLLEVARTDLRQAQLNLQRATIRAPFDGVWDQRLVEVGDYVGIGDPLGVLIQVDPLLARGDVSELQRHRLHDGMSGEVILQDGQRFAATVHYVAKAADSSTRTYPLELKLANPDNTIPAGMTAKLRIPTEEVMAHKLSAGIMALSDAGEIGVKQVDETNTVQFVPVTIIKSSDDAVWVSGLPETVRLIVVGQGFVAAGDKVDAVETP